MAIFTDEALHTGSIRDLVYLFAAPLSLATSDCQSYFGSYPNTSRAFLILIRLSLSCDSCVYGTLGKTFLAISAVGAVCVESAFAMLNTCVPLRGFSSERRNAWAQSRGSMYPKPLLYISSIHVRRVVLLTSMP